MSVLHEFGGNWTEKKLNSLRRYLIEYTKIFKANERAKFLTTYYVDAFAGTGSRAERSENDTLSLFENEDVIDVEQFYAGSARIALQVEPSFDNFIFVEKKPRFAEQLSALRDEFPAFADRIQIHTEDANAFLQRWCRTMNWRSNRAVVFLDPYGMAVDWETMEAIAATKSIDLWILLPIGQAINRMLTKDGPPEGAWADKLTRFFGTDKWQGAFYQPREQLNLFEEIDTTFAKTADFNSISQFFVSRLETVFEKVSRNHLLLCNSRRVPIFALYFAASNPVGAPTAVRIANHILGR